MRMCKPGLAAPRHIMREMTMLMLEMVVVVEKESAEAEAEAEAAMEILHPLV